MNRILYLLVGFALLACSRSNEIFIQYDAITIDSNQVISPHIDSIIQPYRADLEKEMDQVIAYAPKDFTKGRPDGSLNNWACDAVLNNQSEFGKDKIVMCLLNVGGLRNPISMGDVTIGDMYKLMPFDNEVVWVEMPFESLPEINTYLKDRNGEPIGGVTFEDGKVILHKKGIMSNSFWIVTSDYLMGGGDNMAFFEKRLQTVYANILLRDLFIEEAQKQKELVYNDEHRYSFE